MGENHGFCTHVSSASDVNYISKPAQQNCLEKHKAIKNFMVADINLYK